MKIVTAKQWGMPAVDPQHVARRDFSQISEANIHHSDSPRAAHSKCAGQVRGFDSYHRNHNGWAALGYHRVICPHGYVYLGRDLDIVPAAALDHNTPIIAYCLIAENEKATPDQWRALVEMIAADAAKTKRTLAWTTHREVWPHTTCPGDPIQAQVTGWRKAHGTVHDLTPPLHKGKRQAVRDVTSKLTRRKKPVHGKDRRLLARLRDAVRKVLAR